MTATGKQPHTAGPWRIKGDVLMSATGTHLFELIEQPGLGHEAEKIKAQVAAASDMLAALKLALIFIEGEAENRADAGSEYSDYEREPRELADNLRAVLAKAEGR